MVPPFGAVGSHPRTELVASSRTCRPWKPSRLPSFGHTGATHAAPRRRKFRFGESQNRTGYCDMFRCSTGSFDPLARFCFPVALDQKYYLHASLEDTLEHFRAERSVDVSIGRSRWPPLCLGVAPSLCPSPFLLHLGHLGLCVAALCGSRGSSELFSWFALEFPLSDEGALQSLSVDQFAIQSHSVDPFCYTKPSCRPLLLHKAFLYRQILLCKAFR